MTNTAESTGATEPNQRPAATTVNKRSWPLGVKYANRDHAGGPTKIRIQQNWPDPEIRGTGIVKSKDGRIKHGSNTIKCGG